MIKNLVRKLVKPRWRIRHSRNGMIIEFWSEPQAERAAASRNAWMDLNDISPFYGRWTAEKNR